ncbi:MAG: SU10 major capsid protein [Hyphomicrobium sp.]
MATITNAFTTSSAIGIREDLTNRIHRVDVEDTPFLSGVGTTTAKQPLHSWQTRTLGAVNTANAEPEGNETARAAATANVRLSNVCQISTKNATVSGTLESSDLAGRTSEMALQMADRMIELRKDMEYTLLSNQAYNAGATRTLRGAEAWYRTNTSRGVGGADPADPNVTPGTTATDGTQRAFTETLLLDQLQEVFTAGGSVSMALMGPGQKRTASTFAGRAASQVMVSKGEIRQATQLYDSDFGTLKFVTHRYTRSAGRTVHLIDPDNVKVAYLRKFVRFPLAKIGDAETRQILSEYTLEMCNEKAHGVIADLL